MTAELAAAKLRELDLAAAEEAESDEVSKLLKSTDAGDAALRNKLQQLSKEVRTLKQENGVLNKRVTSLSMENDNLSLEARKATASKERLEALCRELQARNKSIMAADELARAEEAAKRKELTEKFQGLVDEFTKRMEAHLGEAKAVTEQNELLRQQLTATQRQQSLERLAHDAALKQKELELKHAQTVAEESFKSMADSIMKLHESQSALVTSKAMEAELNARLDEYGSKYDTLRQSLSDSTAFFEQFKKHKDDMDRTVKSLAKERDGYAKKCANLDKVVMEMAAEKVRAKEQLDSVVSQKDKLQSLCRALQVERNELRKDLAVLTSASESAPPPLPPPSAPEDVSTSETGTGMNDLD